MIRECANCGEEITLSWGAVKAGDFLDFVAEKRENMRELCEVCQYKVQWTEDGKLKTNETQEAINKSSNERV